MTYLHPIDHMELSPVIHIGNVARPEPSIGRLGLLRRLWIPPVALHDILRTYPQLSALVSFQDLGGPILGHDLGLAVGIGFPDRRRIALLRRIPSQYRTGCP